MFQIRPARASDAKNIAACDSEGRTDVAEVHSELERSIARLWVAIAATELNSVGSVVGFVQAWHVASELHILNVATHPHFRRKGIATALLLHAIRQAKSEGVDLVLLEVRPSNEPALRTYAALGFKESNRRKGYYSDGEDALEMALSTFPARTR